jgi:hypothetical protein
MRVAALLVTLLISCSTDLARSAEMEGLWLGYEPIPNISPNEKDALWFYENRLTVLDGVVRLDKLPVWKRLKDKRLTYSAADGAYPSFKGRLDFRDGGAVARLEIVSCDYCGEIRDSTSPERKAWTVIHHGIERQGEPKDYQVGVFGQTLTLDKMTFQRVSKFPHE